MIPEDDITEEELEQIYEEAYVGSALNDDEIETLVEDFNKGQ
jgi:hypothetical protein